MNINQLRYFVAAAERRSFTSAAAQFEISQTAITQQIRTLEESLGVVLFDRSNRPITLTPAGNAFLTDAKAILERLDRAMDRVQDATVGFVGTLRVGYTKGFERSDLSEILRGFHAQYPNILVTCYRSETDVLADGLLKGEYDIIFTWDSTEISKDAHINMVLVEKSPLVVALYASHPFAGRAKLQRSELQNERILYMSPSSSPDSAGDRRFFELYHSAGYHPNIVFSSNDVESVLMMVAAEEGVSVVPAYATSKLTNAENLTFIPLLGDHETVEIVAAWRHEEKNPVLHRFVEFLKEQPEGKNDFRR